MRIASISSTKDTIDIQIEVPKQIPDEAAVSDISRRSVPHTWECSDHQKAIYEQFVQRVKQMLEKDLGAEIILYEESTTFRKIDGDTYKSLSRYIYFKSNKLIARKRVIIITLRVSTSDTAG